VDPEPLEPEGVEHDRPSSLTQTLLLSPAAEPPG